MRACSKQLQLQRNYYLAKECQYNSGIYICMPFHLNGAFKNSECIISMIMKNEIEIIQEGDPPQLSKELIETIIPFQRIQKRLHKRKKFKWLKAILVVIFGNYNTHVRQTKNLLKLFFVKCTYASDCETNMIRRLYKTRNIGGP